MPAVARALSAVLALAALAIACSPSAPAAPPRHAPAPQVASVGAASPAAGAPASQTAEPSELPALTALFEAEQVTGTIAVLDTANGALGCSDVARCRRAVIPASTFKIPHSLIAVELGVLEDSESLMPWDGKERSDPEWNRDHTLRSALRVSCVPCFQAVARSIGPERMQAWLARLGYGNANIGGGIDRFWLTGTLRISPLEQLDFLRRLDEGRLPLQPRTLEIVRDAITLDVGPNHVFRGKTGWSPPGNVDREYGWFVGWVELGERRVYFATLIDEHAPDVDVRTVRRRLTETILRSLGVLPA